MAQPKQHGAGYPGVPEGVLSNSTITAQSILPKAGPNKPMAKPLRMVTPYPVEHHAKPPKGGGRPAKTGSVAKKSTTNSRLGF